MIKLLSIFAGCFVVFLILLAIFAPFTQISAGHVGVVSVFGEVQPEPLPEGFHIVHFLSDVEEMSGQIQKAEGQQNAASADLQDVTVTCIINYKIDTKKAPEIYRNVGWDFVGKIISPALQETLKAEIALHNASDILKQRPRIKENVQAKLTEWCQPYGILITEMSLSEISFSAEYEHAIEQKQLEEQKAEQKKYELLQVKQEAQMVEARAEGEAKALKLRAEAEAEYNEKIAKSLTSNLLAAQYYEKWDGKLPTMMLGENSSSLINIPN